MSKSFDYRPTLSSALVHIQPLELSDYDALYAVAKDPLIWEQHPASDRYQEAVFREFFTNHSAAGGGVIVRDAKTQEVIGSSRFYAYNPETGEVELGWTYLARSHWGGKYNAEVKRLLLDHAFKTADCVVFVIGKTNFRSQKAVQKLGAVLAGERSATNVEFKLSKADYTALLQAKSLSENNVSERNA